MTRTNKSNNPKGLLSLVFGADTNGHEHATITPQVALGHLIKLDPVARRCFTELICANLRDRVASLEVDPQTAKVLGSALDVRTFDPRLLAFSPPDPLALFACTLDASQMAGDTLTIQPTGRGLALVEALLSGEEVSY